MGRRRCHGGEEAGHTFDDVSDRSRVGKDVENELGRILRRLRLRRRLLLLQVRLGLRVHCGDGRRCRHGYSRAGRVVSEGRGIAVGGLARKGRAKRAEQSASTSVGASCSAVVEGAVGKGQ